MTGPAIIVESAAAYHFARTNHRDAQWLTTSPYVCELLRREGIEPLLMDELVSTHDANCVGYAAITAAARCANLVDMAKKWPNAFLPGSTLKFELQRAIQAFAYKAAVLQKVREHLGPSVSLFAVGNPAISDADGFMLQAGRFDTLYSVFAGDVDGKVLPFDAPKPKSRQSNGDFLEPEWWTRFITFLNAPVSSVFFRLLGKAARNRFRRVTVNGVDLRVGILSANELVEETVWALAKNGAAVCMLPGFPGQLISPRKDASPLLANDISVEVKSALDDQGFRGRAVDHAAAIVGARVEQSLVCLPALMAAAEEYCSDLREGSDGGPLVILSNVLSAPEHLLLAQALKHHEFPTYVFEHGTGPGLDENHDALYRSGFAPVTDRAVYYNAHQRDAEEAGRPVASQNSIVAGAPRIVRKIGLKGLQRCLSRRAANAGKKRLIAWVTGLYPNNMPFLPHYYRDGSYHALRREIVYDVLGKLDDEILLKLYPTMRYADPDPFAGLMELPANCRSVHLTDFRNLRAGVDLILLDEPGSAIAWSWGAGVPIIYLDTQMRLNQPTVHAMKRAVFYVDTLDPSWREELVNLLHQPHVALLDRWNAMAEERAQFAEKMVIGPAGSPGSRAAFAIMEELGRDAAAEITNGRRGLA